MIHKAKSHFFEPEQKTKHIYRTHNSPKGNGRVVAEEQSQWQTGQEDLPPL